MQRLKVCALVEDNFGKIKVGVSRCLLGDAVRYDGGNKRVRYLTEVLGHYFDGVPFVVPLTLLQHYAHTLQVRYLCDPYYLYPHPKELILRNHA